jgi:hypothetical protein
MLWSAERINLRGELNESRKKNSILRLSASGPIVAGEWRKEAV